MSHQSHIAVLTVARLDTHPRRVQDLRTKVWTGVGPDMHAAYAVVLLDLVDNNQGFFSLQQRMDIMDKRIAGASLPEVVNYIKDQSDFSANLHSFSTTF